jgi:hypothetical protein
VYLNISTSTARWGVPVPGSQELARGINTSHLLILSAKTSRMGESKDKVKVDRKDKGKQVEPSGSSRLDGPPAITTIASYQSSSSIYDSPGPSSRSTPIATPSTVTTPSTAGFGGDETPYHLRDEETPPEYPGDRLDGQEAERRNRRFTFIPSVGEYWCDLILHTC